MSPPCKKDQHAYGDYLTWTGEERWESIDGVLYDMTPAPSTMHQRILGALFTEFSNYLRGKTCEAFMAPFDVRLPGRGESEEEVKTWVQPDIVVICDPLKIDEKGGKGAPDLVVEILSPATARKDMREKLNLYERAGVREYWIVHPTEKTIMVFTLSGGQYGKPEVYAPGDDLAVGIFKDLVIGLGNVFR